MNMFTVVTRVKVLSFNLEAVSFQTNSEQQGSTEVSIYAEVEERGLDIRFLLLKQNEYESLWNWWRTLHPSQTGIQDIATNRPKPPQPVFYPIFDRTTNILENTFTLSNNTIFALCLDNTYSKLTSKTISVRLIMRPAKSPKRSLQITNVITFPNDLYEDLINANDCFVSGHFRQSAIMLRKALESSLRLKLLQSGSEITLLEDKNGNELSLSKKITILQNMRLITNRDAEDINIVKWFGDSGAHGKLSITENDIYEILEPKLRKFLLNLNLKP